MRKKTSKKLENSKRFQALYKKLSSYIGNSEYIPATYEELIKELDIPSHHETIFSQVIESLINEKWIQKKEGCFYPKKIKNEIITGLIRMHPRGFGFVQPDQTDLFSQDIFIPKPYTQNAIDGDRVEVAIHQGKISPKGPEGKVVSILSRGRTHVAGIIHGKDKYGNLLAYVPLMGADQVVIVEPSKSQKLKAGDRLVMEVIEWGEQDSAAVAKCFRYLGHISDASCDVVAAIEEYSLQKEFPQAAIEEAKKFGKIVSEQDMTNREDLRDQECVTIDPETAKDFDDAISITKDAKGHYHLCVHIADVSHYVKKDSAIDIEAKLRCNSVYFPGQCVPMLPKELSENLCSLKPKVNRLAVTVFVQFDSDGNQVNYRIARTIIKSSKRFTYSEAKEVLDGKKRSRFKKLLELMTELCHVLKKKRYERGSIEFALPELRINIDPKGSPVGTELVSYDITHQMVEEFMLKANEIVAFYLTEKGSPVPFRVHESPAVDNMREFAILAGAFGYQLSNQPTQAELQKLFDEALETEYGQYLATSFIRRMRLAVYSPDNIGHYGLSLTHYCHFTSPIRRYIDLVIHRSLFGEDVEQKNLEVIANYCSEQERISDKAENSVILLKKLRLLDATRKKEPCKVYTAVVTRIRNFGVYFEILDYMLEGFFTLSDLTNDYYIYHSNSECLEGTRSGTRLKAGERIKVSLEMIDFITQETVWSLIH